jgi:hypothetical protein
MKLRPLLLVIFSIAANAAPPTAEEAAKAVVAASGGEHWASVESIDFTFNVEQGGKKLVSAHHHWLVPSHQDTVTWNGKTQTVDLENPAADTAEAHARWVNDSYWLLAPLKLLDRGVEFVGLDPSTDGKTHDMLRVRFKKVGLTPGDSYNFYIDPKTHLVARWDYMPSADKKISGTWEGYQEFGGLKLATEHQFGDKRIFFTDLKVSVR